jgi:hypothetical protein
MGFEQMDGETAALWLRMAFFAANPGVDVEDDWGIELPAETSTAPEDECLKLRTVSL